MCGMCSQVLGSRLLAGVALPDQPTGRSGIQLFFRSNTSRIWWRPVRSRVKAVQVKFPVARCPGTGQARCRSCACSSLLAKCFSAGKSSHQRANARTKLGHPQPTPTLAATGTPRDKIVAPRVSKGTIYVTCAIYRAPAVPTRTDYLKSTVCVPSTAADLGTG
jgi:hypothetical protein